MKRKIALLFFCLAMLVALCSCFTEDVPSSGSSELPSDTYVIQYSDGSSMQRIQVKYGEVYSIDVIPQKEGYIFTGLYDVEEGGIQYVTAEGASVSEYGEDRSITLYPQFKPKKYTFLLDYQGGEVSGLREFDVDYDSEIIGIPTSVALENKDFVGWFTEPNMGGIQVSDKYGLLPGYNKLISSAYGLTGETKQIKLYAAFTTHLYKVEFFTKDGALLKTEQVERNTQISSIAPTEIDGKAIAGWSLSHVGETVVTVVDKDMQLFAIGFKGKLSFVTNNGSDMADIEIVLGKQVSLPSPEKTGYDFVGWKDDYGNVFAARAVFEESKTLTAVWKGHKYTLIFDGIEGEDAQKEMSITVGEDYSCPVPASDTSIFTGWYTKQIGGTRITNRDGQSLREWTIEGLHNGDTITAYAHWSNLRLINLETVTANVIYIKNDDGVLLTGTQGKIYYDINIVIEDGANKAYIKLVDVLICGSTAEKAGTIYVKDGGKREVEIISEGSGNTIYGAYAISAINVPNLIISGKANLNAYGGSGETNGTIDGACAIKTENLTVDLYANLTLAGGNGAAGAGGNAGDTGSAGSNKDGQTRGETGESGGNGNNGGKGGNGAEAVIASQVVIENGSVTLTGGTGGNGGAGGNGGTGGRGGNNSSKAAGSAGAGNGGTGGNGGEGGAGGNGAIAILCENIDIYIGKLALIGGNGGTGGAGGNGGRGGNGGNTYQWGAYCGWSGGGGSGGNGGRGGNGGSVKAMDGRVNVNNYGEAEISITDGSANAGGSGGHGGGVGSCGTSQLDRPSFDSGSDKTWEYADNGDYGKVE